MKDFACKTSRPDRFIGFHYFYHPAKNRLLEVIPHATTSRETIERSLLAAKLHGKTAILVKDAPGFAVNRFFVPFLNEAARLRAAPPGVVFTESSAAPWLADRPAVWSPLNDEVAAQISAWLQAAATTEGRP